MALAAWEIVVGILALTAITALVWSLVLILFTPAEIWKAAGLIQWMWLIVVIVMPLVGSGLFLLIARRRLARAGANSGTAQAVLR